MSATELHFSFSTMLVEAESALGYQSVAYLPYDVSQAYIDAGIKRVLFNANGVTLKRALISDGKGARFIILGKDALRTLAVGKGATIEISLVPDPNPDAVDLPEELEAVLDQDEDFSKIFRGLTPGRQRSLAIYVSSAKGIDTRINRSITLANKAKRGELYILQSSAKKKKE